MAASEVLAEQPAPVECNSTNADSTEAVACGSQNGVAAVSLTDRFGFYGGQQYTDPSRYVETSVFVLNSSSGTCTQLTATAICFSLRVCRRALRIAERFRKNYTSR